MPDHVQRLLREVDEVVRLHDMVELVAGGTPLSSSESAIGTLARAGHERSAPGAPVVLAIAGVWAALLARHRWPAGPRLERWRDVVAPARRLLGAALLRAAGALVRESNGAEPARASATGGTVRFALALGLAAVTTAAAASARAEVLVVVCEAPRGWAVRYGPAAPGAGLASAPHEYADEFTGVSPTFILDPGRPRVLTVIWGSSVPAGLTRGAVEALAPTRPERATVLHYTENFLSALATGPTEVWVYALYPRLGVGTFTHNLIDPRGPGAEASTFHAACRFRTVRGVH